MQFWFPLLTVLVALTTTVQVDAYKVVCYFRNWAVYNSGNTYFDINGIDVSLCTHLLYAFAGIDSNGGINIGDSYSDIQLGGYSKFNALRNQHPNLKTLISIGGGNAGSQTFSSIANDGNKRSAFVNNIANFIQEHGFNGADIDWEFPSSSDKSVYVDLFRDLRSRFDQHGYLLTAAVSADIGTIDAGYDVPALSQYLDFINVMTYDMHGSWEGKTGENSPMYGGSSDTSDYEKTQNVDHMMKYWINKGASPSKLILGIGAYGNTFTLQSSSNNGVGAPTSGAGQGSGALAYYQICQNVKSGQWAYTWNADQKSCYAVNGNQWVGYDNMGAVRVKSWYIVNNGLGGAMVWSIDMDDFNNLCGDGKYPLLNSIKSILNI